MRLTPHTSQHCPCHPNTVVLYRLHGEHGTVRINHARHLCWGHGPLAEDPNAGRVAGWMVLVAAPSTPRYLARAGLTDGDGTPLLHCDTVVVA
jgi:hypothetical protein